MPTLSNPTAPAPNPLSYSRADWQRGYQSQPQESAYEITEMEGTLPPDLRGTLFRNGPGLMDIHGQRLHHPFDGDGLICQIAIADGKAHFRNRYVRTEGYEAEQKAGRILYRGVFGTQKPGGWLANFMDLRFKNIANTNVIYWGGKLLALWEAAEPHALDPVTLETLGLDRLGDVLRPGEAFSAHPRIDPGSATTGGEPRLVNFGVKAGLSSAITLYELDTAGRLVQRQTRSIPGFAFLHDFALTPNYAIFFQNPVRLNPIPFALGLRGAGQSLEFQPDRPTQALIVPRDPALPMQTIDLPACFIFHHANAFEHTGPQGQPCITVDSICYDFFPTVEPGVDFLDINFDDYPAGKLWRCQLDLERGTAERTCLADRPCEFPTQNPATVGQPTRYYYLGTAHDPTVNAPLQAVMKMDLQTQTLKTWSFAPQGFMGEPVFVPHPQATAEDEGWVLILTYRADRHASTLVILDAQTLEPVTQLHLRYHIPYGLHGTFVPEVLGL